jgi:hypothetical protein
MCQTGAVLRWPSWMEVSSVVGMANLYRGHSDCSARIPHQRRSWYYTSSPHWSGPALSREEAAAGVCVLEQFVLLPPA